MYGCPYQVLKMRGLLMPYTTGLPGAPELAALTGSHPVSKVSQSTPRLLAFVAGVTTTLLVGIAHGVGPTASTEAWLKRFKTFHSKPSLIVSLVLLTLNVW